MVTIYDEVFSGDQLCKDDRVFSISEIVIIILDTHSILTQLITRMIS
jgi:hypothetical protein